MINYAVAFRYAKALLKLADTEALQDQFLRELQEIMALISQKPEITSLLSNFQINPAEKEQILDKCLQGKCHPKLRDFLKYLIEMNRFKYLPDIAHEYNRMINHKKGIIEALLITVIPGTKEFKDQLQKKLEQIYQKKVSLQEELDPKILGGAILIVANQMLDYSVKGRLETLKDNLLASRI